MVFIVVRYQNVVRTSVYPMTDRENAEFWIGTIQSYIEEEFYKLTYNESPVYDIAIIDAKDLAIYVSQGFPENG